MTLKSNHLFTHQELHTEHSQGSYTTVFTNSLHESIATLLALEYTACSCCHPATQQQRKNNIFSHFTSFTGSRGLGFGS